MDNRFIRYFFLLTLMPYGQTKCKYFNQKKLKFLFRICNHEMKILSMVSENNSENRNNQKTNNSQSHENNN